MWWFPYRVLAGFLAGMLVGWFLTFRVSVADSADRLMFMVGVGLFGAVVGGVLKRVLRR
jgi:fructose-specific phosphotransferase system IIC component